LKKKSTEKWIFNLLHIYILLFNTDSLGMTIVVKRNHPQTQQLGLELASGVKPKKNEDDSKFRLNFRSCYSGIRNF